MPTASSKLTVQKSEFYCSVRHDSRSWIRTLESGFGLVFGLGLGLKIGRLFNEDRTPASRIWATRIGSLGFRLVGVQVRVRVRKMLKTMITSGQGRGDAPWVKMATVCTRVLSVGPPVPLPALADRRDSTNASILSSRSRWDSPCTGTMSETGAHLQAHTMHIRSSVQSWPWTHRLWNNKGQQIPWSDIQCGSCMHMGQSYAVVG